MAQQETYSEHLFRRSRILLQRFQQAQSVFGRLIRGDALGERLDARLELSLIHGCKISAVQASGFDSVSLGTAEICMDGNALGLSFVGCRFVMPRERPERKRGNDTGANHIRTFCGDSSVSTCLL